MWRRRSPCELTPREREVLGLLRLGLTNEEIAERLGVTVAGAKYHVSQILSKLGVDSREEAAVQIEPRRAWPALWPLVAKITGIAICIGAAGGISVLAWATFTARAQSPRMLLDMTPGDNLYSDATNTMSVGAIDSCVSDQAGDGVHTQLADIVIADVQDLVGWQSRLNYDGSKGALVSADFTPFEDHERAQSISFVNLPVDAGIHRSVTSAQNIDNASGTALLGSSYLGAQTLQASPDTPAKDPPDDASYSASSGGVLARLKLRVHSEQGSSHLGIDLATSPNPASSIAVFTGNGLSSLILDSDDLFGGLVLKGTDCPVEATPSPTPTYTPRPSMTTAASTPTSTASGITVIGPQPVDVAKLTPTPVEVTPPSETSTPTETPTVILTPCDASCSGIEGTVVVASCSVEPGPDCYPPYKATIVIWNATRTDRVLEFTTNDQGEFRVPLAPGDYYVEPQGSGLPAGWPAPPQPFAITVAQAFVRLRIVYDSGVR